MNKNKVAIITGGARGIGLGISTALAAEGYDLMISGVRAREDVSEILQSLQSQNAHVQYTQSNVSVAADRVHLLSETLKYFGRVDVLVNNAGVAPKARMDLLEMTEDSYDDVMDINLKGALFLTQLVAKHMIQQDQRMHPRIINISSISADTASINRGEYCISKAAMSMVTQLFADRLADDDIRVFEVRPGIIQTDMTAGVTSKYGQLISEGITPIKRWGLPADIGGVVAHLCSPAFDFCTGNVINVDGGFHIRRL